MSLTEKFRRRQEEDSEFAKNAEIGRMVKKQAEIGEAYNKGISDEQYRRDAAEYAAYVDGLAKRRIAEQNAMVANEAAQMTPDQLAIANDYAELDRRQAEMGQINYPEPVEHWSKR